MSAMSLHGVKNEDVVKVKKVATTRASCKNKKQQASPVCLTQTFPLLQSPPSMAGTEPSHQKHQNTIANFLAKFWFDFHDKGCYSKQHNREVTNLTLMKTFQKHSNKLLQWLMRNKLTGPTVHKTWTWVSCHQVHILRNYPENHLKSLETHRNQDLNWIDMVERYWW